MCPNPHLSKAATLDSAERKRLAIQTLHPENTIVSLAKENDVSRKFLHQQKAKALDAIDDVFDDQEEEKEKVLFYLPITKKWLEQFVLVLILVGHCSLRGVMESFEALLDRSIGFGTVHNIVGSAVENAKKINQGINLSKISVGAQDEIYQAGKPVLAGVDLDSTFCYLLTSEDHCDEDTWGYHLLELVDKGLKLNHTITDGGRGLRAGQKAALGNTPCYADVFHAERDLTKVASYLSNRAEGCSSTRKLLEKKMKKKLKKKQDDQSLSDHLASARAEENTAVSLAKDVQTLSSWLQKDILSLAGPNQKERGDLFDYVIDELRQREHLCPHRMISVRKKLENQKQDLLAFVGEMEDKFSEISLRNKVSISYVQKICELHGLDQKKPLYWQKKEILIKANSRFREIELEVLEVMSKTHRASSLVENLNSRLRNYFTLRRIVGNDYLDLLKFFLNHRCYIRSDRPERIGKSPAELLSGEKHSHWLELLGYQRFESKKAA